MISPQSRPVSVYCSWNLHLLTHNKLTTHLQLCQLETLWSGLKQVNLTFHHFTFNLAHLQPQLIPCTEVNRDNKYGQGTDLKDTTLLEPSVALWSMFSFQCWVMWNVVYTLTSFNYMVQRWKGVSKPKSKPPLRKPTIFFQTTENSISLKLSYMWITSLTKLTHMFDSFSDFHQT